MASERYERDKVHVLRVADGRCALSIYVALMLCMPVFAGCSQPVQETVSRDYEQIYANTHEWLSGLLANTEDRRERAQNDANVEWSTAHAVSVAALKRGLQILETRQLGDKPVALSAMVMACQSQPTGWFMVLTGLDRDSAVQGIVILERNTVTGELLAEKYPVFAHWSRYRDSMDVNAFPQVLPRARRPQGKPVELWADYESSREKDMPPICLSLPREDLEVHIALYDTAGNIGPFVPVVMASYAELIKPDGSIEWRE